MKKKLLLFSLFLNAFCILTNAQSKILFDATKAETAGNADWIIDADLNNLGFNSSGLAQTGIGDESNAQQIASPLQNSIITSTPETFWKGAISYWGIDCVKQGYTVNTLPYNGQITYGNTSNPQDLSNYKAFIVCEPNIVFSSAEKTAILTYVKNGGSLFMVSDHNISDRNGDGWDSPHIWNDLMTNNSIKTNPFGMIFDYNDYSETTTNIPKISTDSILNGPFGTVTKVQFSGGTSLTLSPTSNSTVKGIVYKTGSSFGNSNVYFSYCRYGLGKVAAIGDSSPCDDGTGDINDNLYNGYILDAGGNHRRLLMNATIWLLSYSSTLPVHIIDFGGSKNQLENILHWSADERKSIQTNYEIERSTNGILFTAIGNIPGNSTETATAQYTWIDNEPINGISYYRIKAYAEDNNAEYSSVINIVRTDDNSFLKVLPNPVKNSIAVYFSAVPYKSVIRLYTLTGNVLYAQPLNEGQQFQNIDAHNLVPGIYILRIENNGSILQQERIAKY